MLSVSVAMAVPAHPGKVCVTQPDGSVVTLCLHGDEYLSFNTTDDGYSVVRRSDGFYTYAQLDADGQLVPTGRIAHDAANRTADERAWLENTGKLRPVMTPTMLKEKQEEVARRAQARADVSRKAKYDYNNFRGLIILVQYNDLAFSRDDYAELFNEMVNAENYTGFDPSGNDVFTGSVRDYFYDNSFGVFSPQFDVVGPVTVNRSQYYPQKLKNVAQLTIDAVEAADSLVDFSQYDRDGNGEVDMIYFVFAGLGSNYMGNDERLIWPHASSIYKPNSGWDWQVKKDGVALGRYACSTELYGWVNASIIDGIGTICHEFSHVLGLPDFYDTDEEGSGGTSNHPDIWSVMAAGSYQNNSRTPVGYTLFERYAIGFAMPEVISEEGSIELQPLGGTNTGYRLNTPVKKEFFLLENRQRFNKWDKYLPGHGMLVFRVDSTNVTVWNNNTVNTNPNHNYFELVRAGGVSSNAATDPFPGSKFVRTLNNTTSPANLLTWSGKQSVLGLDNIRELNGNITFDVVDVNVLKSISLPEEMKMVCNLKMQLVETRVPDYAPYTLKWSSADESIATVSDDGIVTAVGVGDTYITVTANDNPLLTASCHVTVEEQAIAASIAELRAMTPDTESALLLNDALVIYVDKNNNAYLRDASGAIVINNKTLGLNQGDKLNGNIYGKLTVVDRVPRIEPLTTNSWYGVESGNDVLPREIQVEDITEADYADMLIVKATPLLKDNGIWAVSGDHRIRVYNTFQIKGFTAPTSYDGKYFDLTGLYLTNKLKDGTVIDELAMLMSPVEAEAPSGVMALDADVTDSSTRVTVYTVDGRPVATVAKGALASLNLRHGIYVVKAAGRSWRIVF